MLNIKISGIYKTQAGPIEIEIADMVERLSIEKPIQTKKIGVRFPSSVCKEAGSAITTVEHSDIRGLDTAGLSFVVELPRSMDGSLGPKAYSDCDLRGFSKPRPRPYPNARWLSGFV